LILFPTTSARIHTHISPSPSQLYSNRPIPTFHSTSHIDPGSNNVSSVSTLWTSLRLALQPRPIPILRHLTIPATAGPPSTQLRQPGDLRPLGTPPTGHRKKATRTLTTAPLLPRARPGPTGKRPLAPGQLRAGAESAQPGQSVLSVPRATEAGAGSRAGGAPRISVTAYVAEAVDQHAQTREDHGGAAARRA